MFFTIKPQKLSLSSLPFTFILSPRINLFSSCSLSLTLIFSLSIFSISSSRKSLFRDILGPNLISSKVIWEYLRTGKSFDEILQRVPDEFYNWVKKTNHILPSISFSQAEVNKIIAKEVVAEAGPIDPRY